MLGRVVILAGTPMLISHVHAAEKGTSEGKIKPRDLPVYDEPPTAPLQFIPEKITPFRKGISAVRQTVCDYVNSLEVFKKYGSALFSAVGTARTGLEYVQKEDTSVVPKAVIITVSGLGGIVAGYKGTVLRKAGLASAAMITAASICYPHQAVDIARTGWSGVTDKVRSSSVNITEIFAPKDSAPADKTEIKDTKIAAPTSGTKVDKSQKDFGQSKPEDKDMYTTRGS